MKARNIIHKLGTRLFA